jgi:hypothetical protein
VNFHIIDHKNKREKEGKKLKFIEIGIEVFFP